jgi:hypothetical protein
MSSSLRVSGASSSSPVVVRTAKDPSRRRGRRAVSVHPGEGADVPSARPAKKEDLPHALILLLREIAACAVLLGVGDL